ncbi:MAG: 50S ribosomal protein L6 [Syntrophus sp. SKADARSKE-3]|nr:50S ribosomal protein L6 [Syntrophus sp. SKADARSKE-3]
MSRIGKKPIEMSAGVKYMRDNDTINVSGPMGQLSMKLPEGVDVVQEDKTLYVKRLSDDRKGRSYQGLIRTLLSNMVTGVSVGFQKTLEVSGVGYRAELGDGVIKLALGYSTPLTYAIPEGISVKVDKQVSIIVSGIDKELVGRAASEIRELKKPEPYKGKGVKYAGEEVKRKVGKSVGS